MNSTPDPNQQHFHATTQAGSPLRRLGPTARPGGRQPNPNTPIWRWSLAGVLLVTVFFLGIFTDRAGWLPRGPDEEPASVVRNKTFAPFWETWNHVHEDYVDQKSVNDVKMTREAIAGMLDALGDEGHTLYLSPEDAQHENEMLHGHMDGIGAVIGVRDHVPVILVTMPNSPARKAGLKPNDILLKVDDKAITQESLTRVVDQVRGAAGSNVTLTIARDGQTEPIQVTITRAKIEVPDVAWHMLPGEPFAHIALRSFGEDADKQLKPALAAAREHGAKGVIFDLRDNQGGYKDQAVKVTSEFLKDGNVFIEEDMRGNKSPVAVLPGGTATDIPLVVLINNNSASAAEICAGALKDHKRAPLVGQKTFGTGTVLQPFPLSDGSELHLATLKWLTPDGNEIWHHGIEPDFPVALQDTSAVKAPEEMRVVASVLPAVAPKGGSAMLMPDMEDDLSPPALQQSTDAQLLRALEILRRQVEGKAEGK